MLKNSNHPVISVIMPVFNSEKFLKQSVESVLNQSLKSLELIVVDDGSTDGSYGICEGFASQDDRIRLFRQENRGAGSARNKGIEAARGDYIHFLDSDDYLMHDRVYEEVLQVFTKSKVDIVYVNLWPIKGDDQLRLKYYKYYSTPFKHYHGIEGFAKEDMYRALITMTASPCQKICKRDIISGRIFPTGKLSNHDEGFFPQLLLNEVKIYFYNIPLIARTIHGDSISALIRNEQTTNNVLHGLDILKVMDHCYNQFCTLGATEQQKKALIAYTSNVVSFKVKQFNLSLEKVHHNEIHYFFSSKMKLAEADFPNIASYNQYLKHLGEEEVVPHSTDVPPTQPKVGKASPKKSLGKRIKKALIPKSLFRANRNLKQILANTKSISSEVGRLHAKLANINTLLADNHNQIQNSVQGIQSQLNVVSDNLNQLQTSDQDIQSTLNVVSDNLNQVQTASRNIHSTLRDSDTEMAKKLNLITNGSSSLHNEVNEIIWGLVFNDAIRNCPWLNIGINPGRWALGYEGLYVLFRTLDQFKPKRILEIGLGESTKIIGSYTKFFTETHHLVIESSDEWISRFQQVFPLDTRSEIKVLPMIETSFKDDKSVFAYENFDQAMRDRSFDLIFIDGPYGGSPQKREKKFSRIDVLGNLSNILEQSFVIIIDDSNRVGEKNTIRLIEQELESNNIDFVRKEYRGMKSTYLIASSENQFLKTL